MLQSNPEPVGHVVKAEFVSKRDNRVIDRNRDR